MYTKINVTLQFRDRMYGGIPKAKDLLDKYIQVRFGAEEGTETHEHISRDVKSAEEKLEIASCGFRHDETGIYIGDYQIKAMLKQGGTLLKITTKKRGVKSTLGEGLFIKGTLSGDGKIYFEPIRLKPDGSEDFAGNVKVPQGKRSILKRCDYIEKGILNFQIWMLEVRFGGVGNLTFDDLKSILELGQELGLGSCRSFEKGKFDMIKFEQVTTYINV